MPTYNISVVIDPTNAAQGARVIETRLTGVENKARGVETAVQRAFDFNAGPAATATSTVDRAMEGLRSTANSTAEAVTRASGSIGVLSASTLKGANDIRSINERLTQLYNTSDNIPKVNQRIINSQAQVRQSSISMGQQFNDFSTQVLAGGSVITAFAQQSGQAAFAMQGFNGTLGTVGRFLAGPWGTILIIATTVLAGFVSKMWESKDSTDAAESALKKFQQRQADIGNFIDATTGKLKEQNRTLIQNAILTRQAQIDENKKSIRTGSAGALAAARQLGSTGRTSFREGAAGRQGDPDIDRVLSDAGGDVVKLDAGLAALAKRRPDLRATIRLISDAAAQTVLLSRENQTLGTEIDQLSGKTVGQAKGTSALIERQVAAATATTALERAQARLNDVRARGSEIDKISDPKARSTALEQYRKDLTGATVAVNNATAAQKAGRAATAAHNKELREQAALAKRVAAEADRMADFISKLRDQGDALEQRGTKAQVTAQIDNFERQFNKKPTDGPNGQAQQIKDAIERNQLLGDEKAILDQLLGPQEMYARQLAALNDLVARGKITQDQYNQSLRELPLTQALAQVDKSLSGTLFAYDAQVQQIRDNIEKAIKVINDAEKAGLIDPEDAERRRVALRGRSSPDGDIVVNGGSPDNQRDRDIADLDRQRREPLRRLDESLTRRPDLQRGAKRQGVDDEQAERMRVLQEARDQELISLQEFEDRKTAIAQEAEDKRKAIDDATTEVRLAAAQSATDALLAVAETYAGKQSGIYKGIFLVSKAFAIAQAVLALQQNIAEASKYGFPQNIPFIAAAVAQGASIISNVMSIGAQFREGGYTGDGGEGEPAGVVHGKEFVMNARATRENRSLLEAMNNGRTMRASRHVAANENGPNAGRPLNVRVDTTSLPGVSAEVQYVTADDVRVLVRQGVARESGKVVASQLRNPNSRPSKAIGQTTTARRKRG